MENNNEAMETENFYYEDIVEGVNMLLTKETLAIFREAGISKKEILDKVEEKLPPIFDKENLDTYCKRFLQFLLINQLNSNFAENIDKKTKMNKISNDEGKTHVDAQMLKKYMLSFNNGDYVGVYNVICSASAIFILIGSNRAKPYYMDRTQIKVYQKYINDYRRKLLGELSKISIPQPVYEDVDTLSEELDINLEDFQVEDFIDDIDNEDLVDDIEADDVVDEVETEEIIEDVEDIKTENVIEDVETEVDIEQDNFENIESTVEVNDFEEAQELEDYEEFEEESFLENIEEDEELLEFEESNNIDEFEKDDNIKEEIENESIDTDSILASIDELDDVIAEKTLKNEEVVEDTLPGMEEDLEELPGFEEDELPEFQEDELPGFEEDELPGFDDEETLENEEVVEDTLPGMEEDLEELPGFEEDELPGFDDEKNLENEEVEDTLPGMEEEDEFDNNDNLYTLEEELTILEKDIDDDLSELDEVTLESLDEVDEILPGIDEDSINEELPEIEEVLEVETEELEDNFESDSVIEETEFEIEQEEHTQIVDERRNYDLNFEDNYYDILDVSSEYLESHPDYKEAKFVEATGGTNLDDFISTMLYLRDTEKNEVVGVFNNIVLYTHNLYTVDDIETVYDKLVEEVDEEGGILKSKSECISYDEYYNQYIQRDISRQAAKYQQEHQDVKMILIPQNSATIEEFVEAALYFIQEDMTGTVLRYGSVSIIASDYFTQQEIIEALSEATNVEIPEGVEELNEEQVQNIESNKEQEIIEKTVDEEPVEEIDEEPQVEIFDKSPEYYKSIAKISKNKTDAYRERHPECKKVMIVVKRDSQTIEDFFEAVRYYNSINKNIIAQYDGVQLIARKYNSADEMIEAYKIKKSRKAK